MCECIRGELHPKPIARKAYPGYRRICCLEETNSMYRIKVARRSHRQTFCKCEGVLHLELRRFDPQKVA